MTDTADPRWSVDALARRLVGESFSSVRYYDQPKIQPDARPHAGRDWHLAGSGIDLVIGGRCLGVTWANDFVTYNLTLYPGSLGDLLGSAPSEAAGDEEPWVNVLGLSIAKASVESADQVGWQGSVRCPVALALDFVHGRWIRLALCGLPAVASDPPGGDAPELVPGEQLVVSWGLVSDRI